MSAAKSVRQVLPADVVEERGLRVQGGDDDLRPQLLAAGEDDAGGAAGAGGDGDLGDRRAGPDRDPVGAGRAGDRVRDRAHPALGEAPGAEAAVAHVADRVVRHHVGGAGLVGAGPGADHPVDRERALDLRRGEPVVEQVGDRHRHQPGHVGDRADVEAPVPPGQPEGVGQVTRLARADRGRDGQQQRAEHVGQAAEPGVPLRVGVGVALGPLRDLVVGALRVLLVQGEASAFRERLVVRPHREDLVAVPLELEVVHDRRREERHHVGEPRHPELGRVGPGRLGRGGAAGGPPRLQDQGLRAGAGEVGGRDQAVVPAADDDRVVAVRCHAGCLRELWEPAQKV